MKLKEKDICVITSVSQAYLERCGKHFLSTYNLPFKLIVYSEDKIDLSEYKNVSYEYLYSDKKFEYFINNSNPNEFENKYIKTKRNKECFKECFEHPSPLISRRICKTKGCKRNVRTLETKCIQHYGGGISFVKSTKKFSYKVFSVYNAVIKYADIYKYIIWLDADIVFRKNKIKKFNANFIRKNIVNKDPNFMMAFLKRYFTYSECGFFVLNLRNKITLTYCKSVVNSYLDGDVYYFQQNHDSFIWDLFRNRFIKKYDIKNIDLTDGYCEKNNIKGQNINVLEKTKYDKFFFHAKGGLKDIT